MGAADLVPAKGIGAAAYRDYKTVFGEFLDLPVVAYHIKYLEEVLAHLRHAFEIAKDYAKTRHQFGRPLCEFQGLQWKFADMKIALDAAELLLYRAATNADKGFPSAEETSICQY